MESRGISHVAWRAGAEPSLIELAAELAKELDNPDLGLLADDMLAQQFIATGDFKNASEHSAKGLAQYDSSRHGKLAQAYGQEDPAQSCAGIDVIASWVLGFSDRSQARERLVHELSAELNNPHSTALGLLYCAIASQFRQDPLATQKYADELFELTNRHELHWMPIAMALKGWATAKQAPGVENLEMIENGLTVVSAGGGGSFHSLLSRSVSRDAARAGTVTGGPGVGCGGLVPGCANRGGLV